MMSFNADASCATNHSGPERILPVYLSINTHMLKKVLISFGIAFSSGVALTLLTAAILGTKVTTSMFGNTIEEVFYAWFVLIFLFDFIRRLRKSS